MIRISPNPRGRRINLIAIVVLLLLVLALFHSTVRAEPYLAVRTGAKCVACHVNPSGGGKRTEYGNIYAQTALAKDRLDPASLQTTPAAAAGAAANLWTGKLNDYFSVGGDFRATAQSGKVPSSASTFAYDPSRAQLYLEFKPLGDFLTVYVDQRVASGAATNREAWALLWFANRSAYLKAGRLFVPFGLRLEDDTAFIRQVTGVNFNSSDDGVEAGLELGPWSASLAMTNGAGGGAETNRGKLYSALGTYVQSHWRVGASLSSNYNGGADRRMQSVFAGLRTGPVSWLASLVAISDEGTALGSIKQLVSLVEANVQIATGHNLKLTYEYYDPNRDIAQDHRVRYSLVWEFVPFQFTQFRVGARKNDGIPQNNAQNGSELFAQWHAFF